MSSRHWVGVFWVALCLAVPIPTSLAGTTERVSVSSTGEQGNGDSGGLAMSADGRFIAFASGASNLVPGDINGVDDVFVHDRATGVTELVSVSSTGEQGNEDSFWPAISADGRLVAFESYAVRPPPKWDGIGG